MRIAIAGSGLLGASLYRGLQSKGHEIVAILQDGRRTRGIKRFLIPRFAKYFGGPNAMTGIARWYKIPLIWIDKMTDEELTILHQIKPDLLLVGGYGIILKKRLLSLPKIGCVNVHSSLLPRHRGPNPFRAVLLAGESESGVTFHVMDEGIDTGDIIHQVAFQISPRDTSYDIYRKSCHLAEQEIADVVEYIENSGLDGFPQDNNKASYDKNPTDNECWIQWKWTAEEIDRFVRAMTPTPSARFMHKGHLIRVSRTEFDPSPVDKPPGYVIRNRPWVEVATGQGTISLRLAFQKSPYPWIWPAPGTRPAIGDLL